MKLRFKKLHADAQIPQYAKPGDAGLDLVAVSKTEPHKEYGYWEYGTGLAVQIPEGFVGLLFPRSSVSKTVHTLANSVGVIDSGYRGEIKLRFHGNVESIGNTLRTLIATVFTHIPLELMNEIENTEYEVGDKIGQLVIVPIPVVQPLEVDELEDSDRGEGGFGSTGLR